MSVLEVLSSLPCLGSRKLADTVLRELEGRGYAVTLYRRPPRAPSPPLPAAPEGIIGEINVPDVNPLPAEDFYRR